MISYIVKHEHLVWIYVSVSVRSRGAASVKQHTGTLWEAVLDIYQLKSE